MEEQKENNIPEPRVTLFGEEINREDMGEEKRERKEAKKVDHIERPMGCCGGHGHHPQSGCGGVWGLAVVLSGIVLLMNTLGLIPWSFWNFVVSFWPTLLILIGIRFLVGRNIIARIFTFLIAVMVFSFVITYSLIQIDSPFVNYLPGEVVGFVNQFK